MHNKNSSLVIGSYNCRSYNSSKDRFIDGILSKVHILFVQEHWLSSSQISSLDRLNPKFLCTGVAGFDSSEILAGRPYGGCAILWRSDLKVIAKVLDSNSRRICAIRLSFKSVTLLLINVYLPYENSELNADEYADQLLL